MDLEFKLGDGAGDSKKDDPLEMGEDLVPLPLSKATSLPISR
jgi:hypothetical protein